MNNNLAIKLNELETRKLQLITHLSKLERQYENAVKENSTERHTVLNNYGYAYVELLAVRDEIELVESQLEYDALPFWKKLFR